MIYDYTNILRIILNHLCLEKNLNIISNQGKYDFSSTLIPRVLYLKLSEIKLLILVNQLDERISQKNKSSSPPPPHPL